MIPRPLTLRQRRCDLLRTIRGEAVFDAEELIAPSIPDRPRGWMLRFEKLMLAAEEAEHELDLIEIASNPYFASAIAERKIREVQRSKLSLALHRDELRRVTGIAE